MSFCGLRLEYITNVLFKNRIYRIRQDPGVEDVGLKNIIYVDKQEENSQDSTHYQDGHDTSKHSQAEEAKYHQKEREKIKDLQIEVNFFL